MLQLEAAAPVPQPLFRKGAVQPTSHSRRIMHAGQKTILGVTDPFPIGRDIRRDWKRAASHGFIGARCYFASDRAVDTNTSAAER